MKFIAKHKDRNNFKVIEELEDFKIDDFQTYQLFKLTEVNKEKYVDLMRAKRIEMLKKELAQLGVDLTSPKIETDTDTTFNELTIETTQQDEVKIEQPINTQKMSRIKKPGTNLFYSMNEIKDIYGKFKNEIEKNVQEIRFSSFDETGIILSMVEIRNDLPKVLPNGVPIKQA